ncbi:MAG: hypothetical protein E6J41_24360 [Chloroflexi bacterium]|nr:MAG: hypothetical protein E6J41_24360 [Chloroflexota bacterium]
MNPSSLVRPPLVFVVMAEAVLVTGLGAVSWHVWQDRFGAAQAAVSAPPPAAPGTSRLPASAQPPSSPPSAAPATPAVGPTPGIRTDASFLSRMLVELNRVEQVFEDLEWRVTKAIVDGIQQYLEGVVMPSIERSEPGSGR